MLGICYRDVTEVFFWITWEDKVLNAVGEYKDLAVFVLFCFGFGFFVTKT